MEAKGRRSLKGEGRMRGREVRKPDHDDDDDYQDDFDEYVYHDDVYDDDHNEELDLRHHANLRNVWFFHGRRLPRFHHRLVWIGPFSFVARNQGRFDAFTNRRLHSFHCHLFIHSIIILMIILMIITSNSWNESLPSELASAKANISSMSLSCAILMIEDDGPSLVALVTMILLFVRIESDNILLTYSVHDVPNNQNGKCLLLYTSFIKNLDSKS